MTKLNSERRSLLKVASAIAVSGVATSFGCAQKGNYSSAIGESFVDRDEFVIRGANILSMDASIGDFVRGDVTIAQGMASTNNLQMKGVNAAVLMDGKADIARETQDIKVVVVPEINTSAATLYMAAINPLVGLTTYLSQLILRKPLTKAGTSVFLIDGSWSNPRVTKTE